MKQGQEAPAGVFWGLPWLSGAFLCRMERWGRGQCCPSLTPLSPLAGRLVLSEVRLTSARLGSGVQAGWVEECACPPGYTGQFCQSCASGFKRDVPFGGPFVACVPCACNQHGDCEPRSGAHPQPLRSPKRDMHG